MKKYLVIVALTLLPGLLIAQEALLSGLDAYARSDWSSAILSFRNALARPVQGTESEAWYWLVMSELSSGDHVSALQDMQRFALAFPNDPRNADLSYQKGRIYHLDGKFEHSLQTLYEFIVEWPEHSLVSSAYYWIGESLYITGRFDEAESIFSLILDRYPHAVKKEASEYRLALIRQKTREEELLRLLKLSHEESLKIIEEYQRREKSYEQAINAYQKRISDMMKDTRLGELEKQLGDEKVKNSKLQDRITALEIQNSELAAALAMGGLVVPVTAVSDTTIASDLNSSDPDTKKKALEELRRKAAELQLIYDDLQSGDKK